MKNCCPNYTFFKIHDPAVHHDTDPQTYCCSLVKRQINYNKEKINTLNTEAHNVRNKLKNSLSTQLLQTVEHKLSYITEKKITFKINSKYKGNLRTSIMALFYFRITMINS